MKTFNKLFEETLDLQELFGRGKKAKKPKKKQMKLRSAKFAKNPRKFRPKRKKKGKKAFIRPILKKAVAALKRIAKKFRLAEMKLSEQSDEKVQALATFLEMDDPDDIEETSWDTFEAEGGEYMVLTDTEADDAARRYIEDSIWAFTDWFLLQYMDEETILNHLGYSDQDIRDSADPDDDEDPYHEGSISDDPEEWFYVFMGMTIEDWLSDQQNQAEGANDTLGGIIESQGRMGEFVDEAVSTDGRGHFLSSYDGEENEEGDFFIYRVN